MLYSGPWLTLHLSEMYTPCLPLVTAFWNHSYTRVSQPWHSQPLGPGNSLESYPGQHRMFSCILVFYSLEARSTPVKTVKTKTGSRHATCPLGGKVISAGTFGTTTSVARSLWEPLEKEVHDEGFEEGSSIICHRMDSLFKLYMIF